VGDYLAGPPPYLLPPQPQAVYLLPSISVPLVQFHGTDDVVPYRGAGEVPLYRTAVLLVRLVRLCWLRTLPETRLEEAIFQ
jgi:hypothetical protein